MVYQFEDQRLVRTPNRPWAPISARYPPTIFQTVTWYLTEFLSFFVKNSVK